METKTRPRVICVDDEPHVAAGLALHLRRRYEVEVAASGQAGLELLDRSPEAAVVISDMRMPHMNGAEFLTKALAAHPNTTRILLTGYSELDAAVQAVNRAQVYRFLVKPCPPAELLRTVEAGADLHRRTQVERDLLERTLRGSIKMLCEIMAISNPVAFGRGTRIQQLVSSLAEKLGDVDRWQVEVAAMLSQLGTLTLPDETAEKLYYGASLSAEEQRMVERAPQISEQLLANIPRLEIVRAILAARAEPYRAASAELSVEQRLVRRGTEMLKAASDFDALEAQGLSMAQALEMLQGRAAEYNPEVLLALQEVCGSQRSADCIREVSLAGLEPGMVFAADVKLTTGTLFVARGYEVTESFLARLKNFRAGSVKEPFTVSIRSQ